MSHNYSFLLFYRIIAKYQTTVKYISVIKIFLSHGSLLWALYGNSKDTDGEKHKRDLIARFYGIFQHHRRFLDFKDKI